MEIKVKTAKTFAQKALGQLLFKAPTPMLFQTRFGIHTFFLKHNLDILVLDNSFTIKKIKRSLKPFSFFFYHPKYQYVLELPNGFIKKNYIAVDDKIKLLNEPFYS